MKVKVNKSDVRSFVLKVEHIAEVTIINKYDILVGERVEKYLAVHPELDKALKDLHRIKEELELVKDYLKANYNYYFYSNIPLGGVTNVDFAFNIKDDVELTKILADKKDALNSLKQEYHKVFNLIDKCRDGNSALKILKDLNFDTSSLLEEGYITKEVKTDILFPCRQEKPFE